MSAAIDTTVSAPLPLAVVWIQLHDGDPKAGRATRILCKRDSIIDDLTKLVKEQWNDISSAHLLVYPHGTPLNALNDDDRMDPGASVPMDTTSKTPLMVVAPVVWIQLHVGDQKAGRATRILCKPDLDIEGLTVLVKEERAVALQHCDGAELVIYPHGTLVFRGDVLDSTMLSNLTTREEPLMVMAPARPLNGVSIDPAPLGSHIQPIRKGSGATETDFKTLIEGEALSNGIKLTHVFLRAFLENFHSKANAELQVPTCFSQHYAAFWSADADCLNHEHTNGWAHQSVVTAFEGSLFSSTIARMWEALQDKLPSANRDFPAPLWISKLGIRSSDDDEFQPRCCDGALYALDPISGRCRPLVTMSNKLDRFSNADQDEVQSDACNLMAAKPKRASPWPMLILMLISTAEGPYIKCQALVPVSVTTLVYVNLVETMTASLGDLYRWLDAVTKATFTFLVELNTRRFSEKQELPFASSEMNLAFCRLSNCYFKYYHQSKHRKPNIELIRKFIDINAALIDDGDGKPIFVRMKNVGKAWPWHEDAMECSALRFVELVQALVELHGLGVVHGDIRLANVVLEGKKAYLIDFDFAGRAGLTFYPPGLSSLEDGGRHEDVENAIQQRNVCELALQFEHDWYSLVCVMKLFTSMEASDNEKWGNLILFATQHSSPELVAMDEDVLRSFDFKVHCIASIPQFEQIHSRPQARR